MKNVLIFMVAMLLLLLFTTISIIIALEKTIRGKSSSSYFFECALAVDVLGSVMGQHIWNFIFITKQGYQFGKRSETMSSVLGKNQRNGTLIFLGRIIVKVLNFFQKDHCLNSITNLIK